MAVNRFTIQTNPCFFFLQDEQIFKFTFQSDTLTLCLKIKWKLKSHRGDLNEFRLENTFSLNCYVKIYLKFIYWMVVDTEALSGAHSLIFQRRLIYLISCLFGVPPLLLSLQSIDVQHSVVRFEHSSARFYGAVLFDEPRGQLIVAARSVFVFWLWKITASHVLSVPISRTLVYGWGWNFYSW